MAATQDTFPSFAECSRQARDIERSMMTVRQSQIAGKLRPDDTSPIFPKEFDEYTAAYLVSEAVKVERRLFASNYQSSLTAAPPSSQRQPTQSLEQKEAEELHQLATLPPSVSQQPSPGRQKPSFAEQMANIKFPFQLGEQQKTQPQAPAQQQAEQQSPYSQPPAQVQPPAPAAISPPPTSQQYARPPSQPQPVSALPPAPRIPSAVRVAEENEKDAKEKTGEGKEEFEEPSGKKAEPDETEAGKAGLRPGQVLPPASKSSLMASSKVSPRLRAIIEEKLRREEQNEAEKEGDAKAEPGSQAVPEIKQEKKEDEAPALSSRERLLRRLQKEKETWPQTKAEDAPEEKLGQEEGTLAEREEEAEEREEAPEGTEKPRTPLRKIARREEEAESQEAQGEPEEEKPEERVKAKETPMRRRTELTDSAYGYEEEKEEPSRAEPEAPARKKTYRAPPQIRAGGITIKPIFSGEAEEQPGQNEQPKDAESENRMDRIKRIVQELSPDKYKAQAIAPSRPVQKEMDEGLEQTPEKGKTKGKEKAQAALPEKGKTKGKAIVKEDGSSEGEMPGQPEGEEAAASSEEENQTPPAKNVATQKRAAKGGRKAAPQKISKQAAKAAAIPGAPAQKPQMKQPPKTAKPSPKQPEPKAKAQPPAQARKKTAPQAPVQAIQTKSPPSAQTAPSAQAASSLRQTPSAPKPLARTPYPTAPARQMPTATAQPVPSRTAYSTAPASSRTAPQPVSSRAAYSAAPRIQPAQAASAAPLRTLPKVMPSVSPVQPRIQAAQTQAAARPRIQSTMPPAPSTARPRILPGGVSHQALPRTYVPPIRRKLVPQEQEQEAAAGQEEAPEETEKPRTPLRKTARREEEEEPEEEKPERIQVTSAKARFAAGEPPSFSGVKPKKAALDEPVSEKTQDELEEEKRVSEKAEKLSQMAKPRHEIAGDAELPPEQEEDTDIPMPPPEDAEMAPADYEGAKEGFKRKAEQEGIREKTKEEVEAELENYAKENLVWLHEIYAMGGMSKEDFLQKVKDKIAEEGNSGESPQADAPANPALSNLGKEIDKRYKK